MKPKNRILSRLTFCLCLVAIVGVVIWGLSWVNERMTVRYQAIGLAVDDSGTPVVGVEAVLLLEPPPPVGPSMDALFKREGIMHRRYGADGQLRRFLGPTIGISDHRGIFVVRTVGRTGPAQAIRLNMDTGGRPPYERAWLVLRLDSGKVLTKVVSILGWRRSPKEWSSFVNRLPRIEVSPSNGS